MPPGDRAAHAAALDDQREAGARRAGAQGVENRVAAVQAGHERCVTRAPGGQHRREQREKESVGWNM